MNTQTVENTIMILRLSKNVRKAYQQWIESDEKGETFAEFIYLRFDSLHDANKHFGTCNDSFYDFR
jgi:hypothetical protein